MRAGRERPFRCLGVRVQARPFDAALAYLLDAPARGLRLRAHFSTVHMLVEAADDPLLRARLNAPQAVVHPDGMPLVWLGRAQGRRVERVCGPDALPALLDRSRARGLRHFFYGGGEGVAERLAERMEARYPGLRVVGTYTPPFRPLTPAEDAEVVARINAATPDFVWVGLGAPRQDHWVAEHRDRLDAAVLLAVGAAFDFHAGTRRRAPVWAQRAGVEWLHRLLSEPRRLWRRYTTLNLRFAWLVLRDTAAALLRRTRRPQRESGPPPG